MCFINFLFQNSIPDDPDSTNHQKLAHSFTILSEAYSDQAKLMLSVSENIGVCTNFDQVVFYAAIWTHQPCIDQNCFLAQKFISDNL